ncbi:acetyl-CoA carboxylase biotin carboxyl carrier protein [Candidatus Nitrospira nitrificans]|uniref:Biotin carboxyl carrier protein of acetyl-CoA carboxylase n=1 Tax=Candidatus Nitrospira nitrificans TaxID=1742973 RepID=A0A0S4LQC5_9BACT|nr:acetyl-CoA carboxylase biotin carboxyl carrier protein [Candidatus Nitrospira nitrificans]CUS38166.1 Biotin carboxyl carrier protein of acetyl-CoA carboxylase [Candidatus Nitrospira nitrificans]
MSRRRSTHAKTKARRVVLPQAGEETGHEGSLTGGSTKQIQELIDLLRRNNLTELEFERQGIRIRVRHDLAARPLATSAQEFAPTPPQQPMHSASATTAVSDASTGFLTVTSPIVGTFYRSPSPDADPYVEEGDVVKKGQVLCVVEAMKLMNEIESEVDGRLAKILVENTKSVEYGQALFLIDPKAAS